MRTRHRVPTFFSIWMLDVFCCALGCVILLWLWNERLAKTRAQSFEETHRTLESTRLELSQARTAIEALTTDLSKARGQIAAISAERDDTAKELGAAEARMKDLTRERDKTAKDLANARSSLTDLRDRLAKKDKELERADADIASLLEKKRKDEAALKVQANRAQQRVADLELLMRNRDRELTVATAKSKNLADQLHDLEGQLKMIRDKSDASIDEQGKKLAAADARVKELEKFLTNRKSIMVEMQGQLDDLQGDKKTLSEQLAKLRLAADNRFAGIQLSGRRVVFLVDMSGSMKMVDEKTVAPDKWPTVASTVVKVMKSLPDLEKFQLIIFNESASFPLGSANDWIDFDPATSPEKTKQAILAVEPKGNTNLYAPFEAAFRLRSRGLDTVYLLSDGLPNVGPGLSFADQQRQLTEEQKGEILGRYLRQTLSQNWNRPASGWAKVRINSIGFFYESPDLGAFLWALARENDGSFVGMSKP
jgi:predicted  nucleic acid-binding Zn-ribbon protein